MQDNKRYYWLGPGGASDQDHFFIQALDNDLWEMGDKENWDTCWYTGMPEDTVFEELKPHQTVNHIPGNNAITIKSNLYDTLVAAKHRLAGSGHDQRFHFFPETFSMPEDYFRFQQTAQAEPEQLWIRKPKNLSRGRGIDMVRHASSVPIDEEWIIQRYLSRPHLCQGRKYVLRCYVLITSVEPLRFYWYQNGFAKLASESYSTEDLDNLYRHLTNPDINEKNEEAESAVTFISFQKYRDWLNSEGHDAEHFFHELKELIRLTVIATREAMRKRLNALNDETTGCYELIGLDCMVDADIKPWIVECNLSPSLSTYADPNAGADDEVVAKRDMVKDLVGLLGLNEPASKQWSNSDKLKHEHEHCGNFECLFPTANANQYFPLFPVPRYADIQSTEALAPIDISQLQLQPHEDSDHTFADSLVMFSTKPQTGQAQTIVPNEMATWIWLKISEQASPEDIIAELASAIPCPDTMSQERFVQQIAQQVWDVLADWSHANVFAQAPDSRPAEVPVKASPDTAYLSFGSHEIQLNLFCDIACDYLNGFYHEAKQETHEISIDIIPTHYGYSLIQNRTNIVQGRKLSQLLPSIYRLSIEYITEQSGDYYLPACQLNLSGQEVLILGHRASLFDSLSYHVAKQEAPTRLASSLLISKDTQSRALNLPIQLPVKTDIEDALVCETKDDLFRYFQADIETSTGEETPLKLIILEDQEDDEPSSLAEISSAEALKKIWENSHDNHRGKIQPLAQWLEKIEQCYVIKADQLDEAYTQVKSVL